MTTFELDDKAKTITLRSNGADRIAAAYEVLLGRLVKRNVSPKALDPQVEARYAEALKRYELELKQYAAALRHYEMQMRFEWMNRYPFQPYWWDPWPGPYYPPPYPEPDMPTRESVRAQLEKSECKADCGCLPAYDTCFVGCGGQRITETVCIRNCPLAK